MPAPTDTIAPRFPHGYEFGGASIIDEVSGARHGFATHKVKKEWYGLFEQVSDGRWLFTYIMGPAGDKTDIVGIGDTPRDAVESLVQRWTILNGGVESPALRNILPMIRDQLDEVGL